MMCGLCVEACPFDAIYQDTNIELAHADRELLRIDLVTDVDAAKPKRTAKPAAKPAPKAEEKPAAEEGGAQNGTDA